MQDFPWLPEKIFDLADSFVAPLTMAWLAIRWFWMVPDDDVYRNASSGTQKGFSLGMLLAVLVMLFLQSFLLPLKAASITHGEAICASCIGALAGIGTRVSSLRKFNPAQQKRDDRESWHRGIPVLIGAAMGLSALLLYLTFSDKYPPRPWLAFASISLIFFNRLSFLFGA